MVCDGGKSRCEGKITGGVTHSGWIYYEVRYHIRSIQSSFQFPTPQAQ